MKNPEEFLTNPVSCRRGVTMAELMVSAVVLMTIMSFATTLCFQVNRVWVDIADRRIATTELSNQLHRLSVMDGEQLNESLGTLEPSPFCRSNLDSPKFAVETSSDKIGTRIELALSWKRPYPTTPVKMAAWVIANVGSSAAETHE